MKLCLNSQNTQRCTHMTLHCITHTCSETSYRITDVECISRAKTFQKKLPGLIWKSRHEKLCEVNLSTSLLEGSSGSDAAQTSLVTVYYSRLRQQCRSFIRCKEVETNRHGGSRVEPLPIPENWQVRRSSVPDQYHRMS